LQRIVLVMKTILFVAALALGLAGCKKKSETTAAGPSCADAIAKAVGAMPGGPGGGDVQAKLKTIMTTRCTDDKWPADVINCYATKATDMATMKQCREMLPADKQQALMNEIRAVMMGAAGAGGGPMHGAPSGSAAPAEPAGSAAAPAGSAEPPK
jgi:hypothetical protein